MTPEIPVLKEAFLTSDGLINPVCLAELGAAIGAMGKCHQRLSSDPEWSVRKWTFKHEIVGHFAMWACRLSPYGVPDNLEDVCRYLNAALDSVTEWETSQKWKECSLCDISQWLYDILYEQGITQFDAWNRCKVGATPEIAFTCLQDNKPNPDHDFIDLDALFLCVCVSICDERRKYKLFDDKLENKETA